MVASCCAGDNVTNTFLLLVIHLSFLWFFGDAWEKGKHLWPDSLCLILSVPGRPQVHIFKRNPLRFVCVVISIKQLEVHFFNDNI